MYRTGLRGLLGSGLVWLLVAGSGCGGGGGSSDPPDVGTPRVDSGIPVTIDGASADAAPDPVLTLSRTSQDFGSVVIGGVAQTVTLTVQNAGGGSTGAVSVTLAGAPAFTVSASGCAGMTLGAGASCTVTLAFAPSGLGASNATLTVMSTPGGSVQASLTGTGIAGGSLVSSPTLQDFGSILTGTQSPSVTFTVSNPGGAATGSLGVVLGGVDATQFSVTSDSCTGLSLNASGTCTVGVRFTPSTAGPRSATLRLDASPGGALTIALTGTGLLPGALALAPESQDFGSIVTGQASTEATFTITNTGGADSGVPAVLVGDSVNFTITMNGCAAALPAGASCTVRVRFNPSSTGSRLTSLTVTATPGGTAAASLTGVGLAPALLSIQPAPLQDFGPVIVGGASSAITFMVTNTGAGSSGMPTTVLTDSSNFTIDSNGCTAALAGGASCSIVVRFTPTTPPGAKSAQLAVSALPGGSTTTSLSGTALSPGALTISPLAQPFGTVAVGATSATFGFTVTNTGGSATGALTSTLGDLANYRLDTNTCTGVLMPAASCTLGVTFVPATVGSKPTSLSVVASPGGAVASSLSGTGSQRVDVLKSGTGAGTVTSFPAGISCGTVCGASFTSATVVLTAAPDASSDFTGWTAGPCSGTGTCVVQLDAARSVTAGFAPKQYILTVAPAGTGSGRINATGITCPSDCSESYVVGTSVTLSAFANAVTSDFLGWSGGGCSGTGSCVVSMTAATTVTANFALKNWNLSTSTTGTGTGTVSFPASPVGVSCGATCRTYSHGSMVTLTALPNTATSDFLGWSGGGCGGTGTCTVTVTAATTVTASFGLKSWNLTTATAGTGTGTVAFPASPAGISCGASCRTYVHGTMVTLTATADPVTSNFGGWSGGGCGGTGTCTVTLTAATTVTATFTPKPWNLTVGTAGTGAGSVSFPASPAGVSCGSNCRTYDHGAVVTLTSVPDALSYQSAWSAAGCLASSSTCTVTITAATSVTATLGRRPITTITRGPASATNSNFMTVEFVSDVAGSTFLCRVDGSAVAFSCSSPTSTAALTQGVSHTFTVAAVDPGGHADLSPASVTTAMQAASNPLPLLYYRFDGNGTNEGALAGFAATVANVSWVNGKFGNALKFNGALGSTATLAGTSALWRSTSSKWTIGFWFRQDAQVDNNVLMALGGPPQQGIIVNDGAVAGSALYVCTQPNGCTNFAAPVPALSTWHHMVLRYDGGSYTAGGPLTVYVDDVLVVTLAAGVTPLIGAGLPDLVLGSAFGTSNFFVDDLKIYDNVYSQAAQCTSIIGGAWNGASCTLP